MDAVPREAARLAAFLGDWSVEGTLTADGRPAAISGQWHYAEAAEGWGVCGELVTEIAGLGSFKEYELIGFDPAEAKVHLISMNRFAVRDHIGDWISEDRLQLAYRGLTAAGEEIIERFEISFAVPGELTAEVIETVDGVVAITTVLRLVKQG